MAQSTRSELETEALFAVLWCAEVGTVHRNQAVIPSVANMAILPNDLFHNNRQQKLKVRSEQ